VRETFNVAKHADICFVVDGEPIHAHRLVIGLRIESPIIESFLASPNKYLLFILIIIKNNLIIIYNNYYCSCFLIFYMFIHFVLM
jgi:hypothetical protein